MKKRSVAEPVQVYLAGDDRDRLTRMAGQLDTTKSAVLRQAIRALELQMADPESHPALRLIGLATRESSNAKRADAARSHDEVLADTEEAGWRKPGRKRRGE